MSVRSHLERAFARVTCVVQATGRAPTLSLEEMLRHGPTGAESMGWGGHPVLGSPNPLVAE